MNAALDGRHRAAGSGGGDGAWAEPLVVAARAVQAIGADLDADAIWARLLEEAARLSEVPAASLTLLPGYGDRVLTRGEEPGPDTGLQAEVAVGDAPAAVLRLAGRHLDDGDARLVRVLADAAATALAHARVLEEARRAGSVATRVHEVAEEYAPALGFHPAVRARGPLRGIGAQVADQLLLTLREALANVARHARASTVSVEVEASPRWLMLRVSDDGVGIPSPLPRAGGLARLRDHAVALGGVLRMRSAQPGTCVEWLVPTAMEPASATTSSKG